MGRVSSRLREEKHGNDASRRFMYRKTSQTDITSHTSRTKEVMLYVGTCTVVRCTPAIPIMLSLVQKYQCPDFSARHKHEISYPGRVLSSSW